MLAFGGDGAYFKIISKFPSNFGQACDAENDFNSLHYQHPITSLSSETLWATLCEFSFLKLIFSWGLEKPAP